MKPSSSKKYQNSFKTKLPMPPLELPVMPPFDFLAKLEHQRLLSAQDIVIRWVKLPDGAVCL